MEEADCGSATLALDAALSEAKEPGTSVASEIVANMRRVRSGELSAAQVKEIDDAHLAGYRLRCSGVVVQKHATGLEPDNSE